MVTTHLKSVEAALRACLCGLALVALGVALSLGAEPKSSPKPEEKAIRATATAFVEAFNRGSAKDVAELWTPDGSLSEEAGQTVKGREAIEKQYAQLFKERPDAKIEIDIKSIEFPAPGVAVEDGVAQVAREHGPATSASHYTAVHALRGGKWLMTSVRENPVEPTTKPASLESLAGLIGKWTAQSQDTTFQSDFHWIADKWFIQRDYTTSQAGKVIAKGTQIIGVDPQSGRIRSWSFDASGGHGVGLWKPTADGWRIESAGVGPDGVPTRATDRLIRPAGETNVVGWRSVGRRVGGRQLADSEEIVFDRVTEQQKTSKVETD